MTEISLILPFGLPPPELAADLVRAMNTPALAALLSRSSHHVRSPFDQRARALPHELLLAEALGLTQSGAHEASRPAFAAAAMGGLGLDTAPGHWFILTPANVQIGRQHLLLSDWRRLDLNDADARALFDAAVPSFADAGLELVYGNAHTWFVRADAWAGLDTATPDMASGHNLSDAMPAGTGSKACRKLQNEVQMVWFAHPVNAARESRGLAPVNFVWPWGDTAASATSRVSAVALTTIGTSGAIAALGTNGATELTAPQLLANPHSALLYCDRLSEAALATDWSSWLMQMQELEQHWFAPLLEAVRSNALKRLTLILSERQSHLRVSTTAMAQRKFWRRPSLSRLLS